VGNSLIPTSEYEEKMIKKALDERISKQPLPKPSIPLNNSPSN